MIEDKITRFISEHSLINEKDRVLVAYSGGPDSTCLLMILHKLFPGISAVYVNHRLRGKESEEEETFVRHFCAKRNIPLYVEQLQWSTIPSDLEHAARKKRYRHLEKVAAEHGFTKIALAHHRDDVVETFLFRLIRGSGPRGLARMAAKRKMFVRPLLECSRAEIRLYLKRHRLSFFRDTSNAKLTFTRNKLRKTLIPGIEKNFNPAFSSAVERSAKWIEEQNALVAELLKPYESLFHRHGNFWILNRSSFLLLKPGLQKVVLRMFLGKMDSGYNLTSRSLQRLIATIVNGGRMELPGYWGVACSTSECLFEPKRQRIGGIEVDVPAKGIYAFPAAAETLRFSLTTRRRAPNPAIAQLDADKANFPLYIRNWKKGDSFRPLGMKGTKKLSDYFIDKKVPRAERKKIPLVYKDDDLVWVSGYQIHDNYKVTPETKRILIIEARKNA